MASRLGISMHIELRRLWIQDVLSEGVISLGKLGTHHNPSDVLITEPASAQKCGLCLLERHHFVTPILTSKSLNTVEM